MAGVRPKRTPDYDLATTAHGQKQSFQDFPNDAIWHILLMLQAGDFERLVTPPALLVP